MIELKPQVRRFSPGDDVPENGILLIRHGPRTSPDIPPLSAMLTESGIEACQSLGTLLQSTPPIRLFSSPVKRCLDTGTYIVQGANWSLPVLPSEMLGDPGPFVIGKTNEKINRLVAHAQEQNDWSFLHEHIAGRTIPGMRHRDVGAANLVEEFYPSSSGYVLCISHDSIIAAITAAFGLTPDPWPDPLHGLIIQRSESPK